MITRILTSAVLLPIAVLLYLAPSPAFAAVAAAAAVAMVHEAAHLLRAAGRPVVPWASCAAVVLLALSFQRPEQLPLAGALGFATALVVGAVFLTREGTEGALDAVSGSLSIVLLPGLLIAFQVGVRGLGEQHGPASLHGPALLAFQYAVVFGNDSAAYFTGKLLGRTKLCPGISPGKTVEGFVGGVLAGVLLGLAAERLLPTGLGLPRAAGFAFLIAVTAVFGDLTVSLLKRSAGVKDTGRVLPGHGGLLDRFDGLLFTSPLLFLLCTNPLLTGGPR